MKHPWQIWTLFLLCLALVLPAFGWLTFKALELDRERTLAEREIKQAHQEEQDQRQVAEFAANEAEYQEIIASALWRLDWTLTPLVAQEAARPYFVYSSFYTTSVGKGKTQRVPSPLLVQPSEYVLLHFQLTRDAQWTSPQQPMDKISCELAVNNGTSFSNIDSSGQRLNQLKDRLNREELIAKLPKETLPAVEFSQIALANNGNNFNYNGSKILEQNTGVTKDLGIKQLKDQQFSQVQQEVQSLQSQRDNFPRQFNQQASTNVPSNRNDPVPQQGQLVSPADNQLLPNRFQQQMRGYDWNARNRVYERNALSQIVQQRVNNSAPSAELTEVIKEGVTRPVWIDGKLILARRVELGDEVLIQGCWLDWPKIKTMLLEELADVLPEADLLPVELSDPDEETGEVAPNDASEVRPGRMLATLPIQIVVPEVMMSLATGATNVAPTSLTKLTPIQISLLIAWTCMILATGAVAILLRGVVTLSERRGSFVSAVTHELRTPLTTFRMYAEMLAEGMVPNAEKRQHYMETLRVEADRLSHLVENVLVYARLERGRNGKQREQITIQELIDKVESRLADRTTQAEMSFVVEADDDVRSASLTTDPGAVEQILFNLVDNACKYAVASKDRRIHLVIQSLRGGIKLCVRDHGPGISKQEAKSLFRPFSKSVQQAANSAPGVGLGLALCRRLSRALGGRLELDEFDGDGASFALTLPAR